MTGKAKLLALNEQLKSVKEILKNLVASSKANPTLKIFNEGLVSSLKVSIAAIESEIQKQATLIKQQATMKEPMSLDNLSDNGGSLVKTEELECATDYDQNEMTDGKWKSMKTQFKTHLSGWLSRAATTAEQIERLVLDGKEQEEEDDLLLIVISILMEGLGPAFKGLKIISKISSAAVQDAISSVATAISSEVYSRIHKGMASSGKNKITIRSFTYEWVQNFKNFVEESDRYFDDLQSKLLKSCGETITEGIVDQAIVDIVNMLPDTKELGKKLPIFWVKASAEDGMDNGDLTDLKAGHIIVRFRYESDKSMFSLSEDPFIDDVPPGTTHMIQTVFKGEPLLSKKLEKLDIQLEIIEFNFIGLSITTATRENGKWGKLTGNTDIIKDAISMLYTIKVDKLTPD